MDKYDVIVVGSGITGGWAAKEFCEKGFKTLVIERGRHITHRGPEYTDMQAPWQIDNRNLVPERIAEEGRYGNIINKGFFKPATQQFFADESEHPISYPEDKPFRWVRSYQLGGRSVTWGRQVLRWGPKDFEANAKDGHGVPWPIGYDDLAPWYDRVESFIGVSANKDGLDVLPDGVFQKPWEMSCAERFISDNLKKKYTDRHLIIGRAANITEPTPEQQSLGRTQCQARSYCKRGCSFGGYFSSLSATLPAAERTGNLTVVTDAIVETVDYDETTGRASGVTVIDAHSKEKRQYKARVVFCVPWHWAQYKSYLTPSLQLFPMVWRIAVVLWVTTSWTTLRALLRMPKSPDLKILTLSVDVLLLLIFPITAMSKKTMPILFVVLATKLLRSIDRTRAQQQIK
ncbi:GMC family oxidoreductase [Alteromonas sp. KUL49]|uniref:GMC family oxidoreductase N-terminal domain-containing protein n=1 Tax=Alteromonas sp. KUL49 TaxID=2480798 RepID=UPI0010FFC696|nr:GMC family oxidoreductase [Alteromonas sp. KUL49]GEA09869.1 hypothetical protein KUL49_02440 [Alteromonas sp. KUL49]